MPTTLDVLSLYLRNGQSILERLRSEYFVSHQEVAFDVESFLQPYFKEAESWRQLVEQTLQRGFASPIPVVAFKNAVVSSSRIAGTNPKWGGLAAQLEARITALTQILKDADPRLVVPLRNPNTVFLVHGRSTRWNLAISSFLANHNVSVIILEDEPNLGATLIEKFEANAAVGTADRHLYGGRCGLP